MYTEKKEEKFINLNRLNRKRAKSKSNSRYKNKSKNHAKHCHQNNKKAKNIIFLKDEEIKEQKNIENVKQNFRHFFHINWENPVFAKEAGKIGENIDWLVYWFLINCSYFVEDNIQDYVQILKEKYCAKIAVPEYNTSINSINSINNINNMNNSGELNLFENNNNINNNEDELNMDSFDVYNNNENNINNSTRSIRSIMNFLDYDKKGKYFINAFGYNQGKANLNIFKNKLKDYINTFHQINTNRIKDLQKKADIIEENYEKNNNINSDASIKWLNDYPLLTKNNLSYNIHNNYINYLYDKEKKNLLKQDIISNNEKLNKLIEKEKQEIKEKKEEDDDDEGSNKCYVCNDGNINEYPYYFECEQCGLKVHANCYGIKLKHEPKRWKCDICKELSYDNAINIECVLCPNKGGAMKKINILKNAEIFQKLVNIYLNKSENSSEINTSSSSILFNNNVKKADNIWVHLSCALWNEDIKLGYIDSKLNVSITDEQILYKYNSFCDICNKDNCGPTTKCKNDNCNFQCHPECGRINNYFLEVDIINKTFVHNIYCHKHHPNRFSKTLNNINKYKVDSIFAFDDALIKLYQSYRLKYKKEFYYPQRTEDYFVVEKYINLSESHNLNENNNHNKKKKNKKKKNRFFPNINNGHQIKNFENENQKISEIMDEGKEIKEIVLNSCENIKNNINNLEYIIDDKSNNNTNSNNSIIDNNNNQDLSRNNIISDNSPKIIENNIKNDNNQNIFMIEQAQSKCNSSNYINLTNINYNNNISNSDNDMSDTTVSHIKPNIETFLPLEKEIEQNKESFIVYLIGFLNNYFKTNRLIVRKGDGNYKFPTEEEDSNLLEEMFYDDLFSDQFPLNEIQYKGLTPYLIKKYMKNIFPNEEAFNNLFLNRIDSVLKKLKKNEKYKNREIICRNKEKCMGSEGGKYKLLSVDEFKYQILNDRNIPKLFICNECINHNEFENINEYGI